MVRVRIVINVTNFNQSIRQEVGDRSMVKGVGSGAMWGAAVMIVLPWVSKILSVAVDHFGFFS